MGGCITPAKVHHFTGKTQTNVRRFHRSVSASLKGKELEHIFVDYLKKGGDPLHDCAQPLPRARIPQYALLRLEKSHLQPENRSFESGANAHYRKPESQTEVDLIFSQNIENVQVFFIFRTYSF